MFAYGEPPYDGYAESPYEGYAEPPEGYGEVVPWWLPRPSIPFPFRSTPWPQGWIRSSLPYTGFGSQRMYMRCAVWPGPAGLTPGQGMLPQPGMPGYPGVPGMPGMPPGMPGMMGGGRRRRRRRR